MKEANKTEKTEIIRTINKLNSQNARVRILADQINAMTEESLSSFDAALLSMNLNIAADALKTVLDMVTYLSCPIVETSRLWKNGSGQYETTNGYCYQEESAIEVLIPNKYYPEGSHWERTRLLYDGQDYYLAGYPDLTLTGLEVRVRLGDKP